MLVHLQTSAQVDLHGPLIKYAYMKTLAQRTQEAIDAGFTVGELAAAAKKSSSAVSQWLNGTTKSIKADSAIGLEKKTGWNAEWWITGKGDRGETRSGVAQEPVGRLEHAMSILGAALALEMPDDIRQDAADLLAKLALRRGAARHQAELVQLLESVNHSVIVTTQARGLSTKTSGAIDLAHAMSPQTPDDGVPIEGDTEPSQRGTEWAPTNIGTRVNAAGPRTDKPRDNYPSRRKPPKPGKETA